MFNEDYVIPTNLAKSIHERVHDYSWSLQLHSKSVVQKTVSRHIQWIPTKANWVTLNIDGAVQQGRFPGCGRVLRTSA